MMNETTERTEDNLWNDFTVHTYTTQDGINDGMLVELDRYTKALAAIKPDVQLIASRSLFEWLGSGSLTNQVRTELAAVTRAGLAEVSARMRAGDSARDASLVRIAYRDRDDIFVDLGVADDGVTPKITLMFSEDL